MIRFSPATKISIAKSRIAGRGVFAAKDIKSGELIERCPIIETPLKDYQYLRKTELRNYYFLWNKVKAQGGDLWSKKSKFEIKNKKP